MAQDEQDWPEATRSLLEAPARDRIERHGEALLNQALNGGGVIAFVGSGAAMAYGRVSWRDLVRLNQDRVLGAPRIEGQPTRRTRVDPRTRHSRVEQMQELLERHRISATGSSQGKDFMQVFQLTEQLRGGSVIRYSVSVPLGGSPAG